jgi:hypothetical protein
VDLCVDGGERPLDGLAGFVAADGCEEMHLGGAAHELMEGDSATTPRDLARLLQMRDLAGQRKGGDATYRDMLDMADDGEAEAFGRDGHLGEDSSLEGGGWRPAAG